MLLASYAAGLVFSLKTHRSLFNPSTTRTDHGGEPWSVRRRRVIMLAAPGWPSG